MKVHNYYVYIMSNKRNTVYYVGMTNQLDRRYIEHEWKVNKNSFTSKYNIDTLLYYEYYSQIDDAIRREKQIKKYRRDEKLALVSSVNPDFDNLFFKHTNFN